MQKMLVFLLSFLSLLSGLTNAGQESLVLITPHEQNPVVLEPFSQTISPIAISVSTEHLNTVSSSVLQAESWLRTYVLSHYPAHKISTIVVGNEVVCNKTHEKKWGLVLPSVNNIHHSLTRWGLGKDIKVSVAFSQECLDPFSDIFKEDLTKILVKPLLGFLQYTNSTYSVNPPSDLSDRETINMIYSHQDSIKHLGFSKLSVVLLSSNKESIRRKLTLSFTEFQEPPPSPIQRVPFVPAYRNKNTPPPPPPFDHEIAPFPSIPSPEPRNGHPPLQSPLSLPPYGPALPPCNPKAGAAAPKPGAVDKEELWCVAKPSVPEDTLQEAMDYACGEGGGDCEGIWPGGKCYYPNTVISHASYAFNSYWQMMKNSGGTCDFGGTAMIINSDPSFINCQFILK